MRRAYPMEFHLLHVLMCLRKRDTLKVFHEHNAQRNLVVPYPESSWFTIQLVSEMPGVFKNSTTLLSGVYHPTSCLVLNKLYLMTSKLDEFELKKYFQELPPVITCAATLNLVPNRIGVETLIFNIGYDLGLSGDDPSYVSRQCAWFDDAYDNMFQVYLTKYGSSSSHIQTMHYEAGSSSHGNNETIQMFNLLRIQNTKRARGNTLSSELGRYQGSDCRK